MNEKKQVLKNLELLNHEIDIKKEQLSYISNLTIVIFTVFFVLLVAGFQLEGAKSRFFFWYSCFAIIMLIMFMWARSRRENELEVLYNKKKKLIKKKYK